MPRFRLDEFESNGFPGLHDGTDPCCDVRKESGDAQIDPSKHSDYLKSVTEQKRDFSKYIRTRKSKARADARKPTGSEHNDRLENVVARDSHKVKDLPVEEKDDSIKVNDLLVEGQESWLDDFLNCQPNIEQDFYNILKTKAPNLEETNSLLDQVLELRSDLEDRVTELRGLGEEMRKLREVIKLDPFVSKSNIDNNTSMAKVIKSVQTMQNLCGEMEKQSSQSVS